MILEQREKWLNRIAEIFLRYGIKSITMDDISRELGISKKTLYQFVSNKDELVLKVVESHIEQEICKVEAWKSEAGDALEEMMQVMQNVMKEMQITKSNIVHDMQKYHREAWDMLKTYQRGHLMEQVRSNLKRGIREGLYRNDFDLETIVRIHVAQAFLLLDEDWFPTTEFSRDALFREYILHYLNGILTEDGRKRLKAKLS